MSINSVQYFGRVVTLKRAGGLEKSGKNHSRLAIVLTGFIPHCVWIFVPKFVLF